MEKKIWSEKVINDVIEGIEERDRERERERMLLNNILLRKGDWV
jgi:hypothetical protein